MPTTPTPENSSHLGDGVYATFDGYGVEIRVNDHRNDALVYMEPQVVQALGRFLERMSGRPQP